MVHQSKLLISRHQPNLSWQKVTNLIETSLEPGHWLKKVSNEHQIKEFGGFNEGFHDVIICSATCVAVVWDWLTGGQGGLATAPPKRCPLLVGGQASPSGYARGV